MISRSDYQVTGKKRFQLILSYLETQGRFRLVFKHNLTSTQWLALFFFYQDVEDKVQFLSRVLCTLTLIKTLM